MTESKNLNVAVSLNYEELSFINDSLGLLVVGCTTYGKKYNAKGRDFQLKILEALNALEKQIDSK